MKTKHAAMKTNSVERPILLLLLPLLLPPPTTPTPTPDLLPVPRVAQMMCDADMPK